MARIPSYPDAGAIAKSLGIEKENALDLVPAVKSSLFLSDLSKWKSKEKSKGTPHRQIEAAAERMASCWFGQKPELDLSGLSLRSLPTCLNEVPGLKIRDERGMLPVADIRALTGTSTVQDRITPVAPPRPELGRAARLHASLADSGASASSQSSGDRRTESAVGAQYEHAPVPYPVIPPRTESLPVHRQPGNPQMTSRQPAAQSTSSGQAPQENQGGVRQESEHHPSTRLPPTIPKGTDSLILLKEKRINDPLKAENKQPVSLAIEKAIFAEGRSRRLFGKHEELESRNLKGKEARAYVKKHGTFSDVFRETIRQTGKGALKALIGRKSDPADGSGTLHSSITAVPEPGNDSIPPLAATNIGRDRQGNPDKLPEDASSCLTPQTRLGDEESSVAPGSGNGNPIPENPLLVQQEHERIYEQRKEYAAKNIDIDTVAESLDGVSHQKKGISGMGANCWWRAAWLSVIVQHRKNPDLLKQNILTVLERECKTETEINELRGQAEHVHRMAEAANTDIEQILTRVNASDDFLSTSSRLRLPGAASPEACEETLKSLTVKLSLAIGFELDRPNPGGSLDIISIQGSVLGSKMGQDNQILPLMYKLGANGVIYNESSEIKTTGKEPWINPRRIIACPVDPDGFPNPKDGNDKETRTQNLLERLKTLPVIRHHGVHFTLYLPNEVFSRQRHEGAQEINEGSAVNTEILRGRGNPFGEPSSSSTGNVQNQPESSSSGTKERHGTSRAVIPGFFNLNMHRKSSRQASLLAQLSSPSIMEKTKKDRGTELFEPPLSGGREMFGFGVPTKIFNARSVSIPRIETTLNSGESHRKKAIASSGNNCWWRASLLSVFVQQEPKQLEQRVISVLGSDAKQLAAIARRMAEAAQSDVASILTHTKNQLNGPFDTPGTFKFPEDDDSGNGNAVEERLKDLADRLLDKPRFDQDAVGPGAQGEQGEANQIFKLFEQLGVNDGVIFHHPHDDESESYFIVSHPEGGAASEQSSFAGNEDHENKAVCTQSFIDRLKILPIIVHRGAHFDVYLPNARLGSLADQK